MTADGIQTLKFVRGPVDGSVFTNFMQHNLCPLLKSFDGFNENGVVVMDNCSVHHISSIKSLVTQAGALLHYLPPYSPDLNPIEECLPWLRHA